MCAVVRDGVVRERFEEAPHAEEVGEVLACHLADGTDELQAAVAGVVGRQRVFAQFLEECGIEGRVPLCQVVVEVELPVHAHLALEGSGEEGPDREDIYRRRRFTGSSYFDEPGMEADIVGKEVVRDLGAALDGDGPLVVVSTFVRGAPVVEVGRAAHVERALHTALRVVHRAEGRGVGKTAVSRLALDGEVRVVVVQREDGIAARQVVGRPGATARSHAFADARQLFLPDGQAVEPADTLVNGLGPDLAVGARLEVEEGLSALDGEAFVRGGSEDGLVVAVALPLRVVVAVHGAALDVDLDVGPLAERLRHRLRVGCI